MKAVKAFFCFFSSFASAWQKQRGIAGFSDRVWSGISGFEIRKAVRQHGASGEQINRAGRSVSPRDCRSRREEPFSLRQGPTGRALRVFAGLCVGVVFSLAAQKLRWLATRASGAGECTADCVVRFPIPTTLGFVF
jgi:hypothetical protein